MAYQRSLAKYYRNPRTRTVFEPSNTSNTSILLIIGAIVLTGVILYFALRKTPETQANQLKMKQYRNSIA